MAEIEDNDEPPAATDDINIVIKKDDTNEKYFFCKNDGFVGKKGEKERIKRISEIYFAMPGNKEDRRERNEEIRINDEKLTDRHNKKLTKNIKEKKKTEQKQKVTEKDDRQFLKPVEPAGENENGEKHTGCFGFFVVCFEKRREQASNEESKYI